MRPVFKDHDPVLRQIRDSVRATDQILRSLHPELLDARTANDVRKSALTLAATAEQLLRCIDSMNEAMRGPRIGSPEGAIVSALLTGIVIGAAIVLAVV